MESDSTAQTAADPRYRPLPDAETLASNAPMYRVAYTESIDALKDQVDELNGIRTRLVAYLGFVGSATAFLAGSILGSTRFTGVVNNRVATVIDRSVGFYAIAGLATALLLAAIVLTVVILAPRGTKMFRNASAYEIIAGHIEVDIPTNEGLLLRNLALLNDKDFKSNRKVLAKIRRKYVVTVALGAVQLALLVCLVWFPI